jgi:dihydrofolate reductase
MPDDLTICLVAAVADNGVIGRDGGMPWHHPEDLAHFQETTTGHPVVMGRVTYEGIVEDLGEPLPGRTSVVLTTRDLDLPEGAVAVGSVEAALSVAREALAADRSTVYVAGGATVYEQFLPLADRMVLTEVHEQSDGDTYFPEVDWSNWDERTRDDRGDLSFVTYERRE